MKKKYLILPLIYLFLFIGVPQFGDCFLWLSGSINYLWPLCILLYTFYLINIYIDELNLKRIIIISLFSILTSLTNETTGGMLMIYMIIKIINSKKININKIIPIALTIPGILFVITAPGNYNRSIEIEQNNRTIFTILVMYLKYFIENKFFSNSIIATVIFQIKKKSKLTTILNDNIYSICGILNLIALSFSKTFTLRPIIFSLVLFFINLFNIIVTLTNKKTQIQKEWIAICIGVSIILETFSIKYIYTNYISIIDNIFFLFVPILLLLFYKNMNKLKNIFIKINIKKLYKLILIIFCSSLLINIIIYNKNININNELVTQTITSKNEEDFDERKKKYVYNKFKNKTNLLPQEIEKSKDYFLSWLIELQSNKKDNYIRN